MGKVLTYPFGKITIYDNYLIAVMNEGVTILPELNDVLENISNDYFSGKNFVYITHRLNSYAVDPNIYFRTSKIENLVGFAVVSGKKIVIDNTDLESVFLSKPFKTYNNLDEAIKWANDLCES
ncbi:hypothetical protein C1T31_08145 [Hanstruepera neustonica]|uniref:STAS/SEC14 domain-containing protein n=1 Tax=Hanstruepera neustonica TaxID=1445657 RepID=A0A2K1DY56_9FLAO|nr:hypothetical protein [Hanstruepera neustonica]PNQ72965.1 hypothetical protein C1T31_08145 [Hanstruepera neustonica]